MSNSTVSAQSSRERFLDYLQAGDVLRASREARALLDDHSGVREWRFISKEVAKISRQELLLRPFRVALLSSFSIEFLHAPLVAFGFANGLNVQIYQAGFGQFRQEILNQQSALYAFEPEAVILAVDGDAWIPELYSTYLDAHETLRATAVERTRRDIETLLGTYRARSSAPILIHNLCSPVQPDLGILDAQLADGQGRLVGELNEWLSDKVREITGAYIVDYSGLVMKHGALQWYDQRLKQLAQVPIAGPLLDRLAIEYLKFFRSFVGASKKCVVVDLDNTLWGGVLGEAGIHGIQLGTTYPGSAYTAFQRTLMSLERRGVLLAIASKNNPADVDEVFATRSDMVLKKEHFACMHVSWRPKSEAVGDIAQRLNINPEHIVFVDDNPVECEEVGRALPMVHTICLPAAPDQFVQALLADGLFDTLTYSGEDRRRTALYHARSQAQTLQTQVESLDDFYRSLGMVIAFAPVERANLARASQLTQKTNQFNATTRRYSEAQILDRVSEPSWLLTTVTLSDRFGDHGIIGLVMSCSAGDTLEIDTLLLSCRVIGRCVETAMLAHLCEQALSRGVRTIRGTIVLTLKNLPIRDLFQRHGFQAETVSNDTTHWVLELPHGVVSTPDWFEVRSEDTAAS